MMNDDTLVLYYYNDGLSSSERRQVANSIATDAEVASRYEKISAELNGIADFSAALPPPDMVQRWHRRIDQVADRESGQARGPGLHSWSFLLGVAVTAALAIGVGIGVFVSDGEEAAPTGEQIATYVDEDPSSAFIRGLRVHLRESQEGLSSLSIEARSDKSELILNIIDQNRLFVRAAKNNDADKLARVLRAFELVLIQLAAEDISPEDEEALRAKLLFELNVMLTKLAADTSDDQEII